MKRKRFIKKKEDFVCEICEFEVKGTGYTNHCPKCLWSKHLDEEVPGDRASNCGGLMMPVGIDQKKGEFVIIHRCQKCGKGTKNKISRNDDFEKILFFV